MLVKRALPSKDSINTAKIASQAGRRAGSPKRGRLRILGLARRARTRLHPKPPMMPADHAPCGDRFRAELARLEVERVAHLLDTEKVFGRGYARIGDDDTGEHIERGQERHLQLRRRRQIDRKSVV